MRYAMAALLMLAGCGEAPAPAPAPEPEPRAAMRPPAKQCADAREGLDALKASAALDYDAAGEATIFQEAWLQLPPDRREIIANALAVHAACAAPQPPLDQEVTIRGEGGIVLMRRTVELAVDPMALLEE